MVKKELQQITSTIQEQLSPLKDRGRRLKRLRNLANLSRREVEEKYHIKLNTLKGWELGRHGGLTELGAKKMLQLLEEEGVNCNLEWLLYGNGSSPQLKEKIDSPASSMIEKKSPGNEEKQILDELTFFHQGHPNAIDLLITDDGMSPYYEIGEYVAGINRSGKNIDTIINSNCIVQTVVGEKLLRHLKLGEKDNRYTLVCLNPHTTVAHPIIYNTEIISAAPIIWRRKKNPA